MISKEKIDKLLGFTLAEILITMIVIALMTLASIPVIKHSKEYREAAKDRNTWMAFYDQNDRLVVYQDGSRRDDLKASENGQEYAKFIPPEGVTRFNVTVIGGGGGGAAGEAGLGVAKSFFPIDSSIEQIFVPISDGLYRILAIGGGGGGGGGGVGCDGKGGYSGAAVAAIANLKQGEAYAVSVGVGAGGGPGQGVFDFLTDVFAPIGFAAYLAAGLASAGTAWVLTSWAVTAASAIANGLQSDDRMKGGGNGGFSLFTGNGVEIVAPGGGGGQHVRKKFSKLWPKCKATGGCGGENANGKCTNIIQAAGTKYIPNSGVSGENVTEKIAHLVAQGPSGKTGGRICTSNVSCKDPQILNILNSLGLPAAEFGNGGNGGGKTASGKKAQSGIVVVQELPVFGGGSGSPGAVSFYSYTKSPLSTDEEKEQGFVKVFPGLGGLGGESSGAEGEDGMFSRFGNRIIADGGKGGLPRAANPADEDKSAGLSAYQINGKDGIPSALSSDIKSKIKYPDGVTVLERIRGGLNHNNSCTVGSKEANPAVGAHGRFDAEGQGSCKNTNYLIPGSGGAGGGAQGSESFNMDEIVWGFGGKGGSGIVIVTW